MNPKARLRHKADKLFFQKYLQPKCEVCNMEARQLHHYYPKGLYGHLRYDPDNAISLCMGCHFRHHHRGDPAIHQTIQANRGIKWIRELAGKAHTTPKDYKLTTKWYREIIEKL